jgi:predicted outer membrane protein
MLSRAAGRRSAAAQHAFQELSIAASAVLSSRLVAAFFDFRCVQTSGMAFASRLDAPDHYARSPSFQQECHVMASTKQESWALAIALAACGLFVSTANAQNPDQVVNPGETLPSHRALMPISGGQPMMVNMDQDVAEWLQIENHGEVAMAKLAETKVQNQSVRQFADHMIHDHSQFLGELQAFTGGNIRPAQTNNNGTSSIESARPEGPVDAGRASIAGTPTVPAAPGTAGSPVRAPDIGSVPTPGSVANSSTVPTPGGLTAPSTTASLGATGGASQPQTSTPQQQPQIPSGQFAMAGQSQGFDFLHAKRQIGDEMLSDMTKEFNAMPQAEIDKAYIGQQIVAHEQYITTSKVLRRYASPRLQNLINDGIKTAQSHLDQAKEIMHELTEANYSEGRTGNNNAK